MNKESISKGMLTYKTKPLVRSGNIIYYGNPRDKFIVKMNLKGSMNDKEDDLSISTNIYVQLIDNSKGFYGQQIVKTSSKSNLYLALEIADIWLERALSE